MSLGGNWSRPSGKVGSWASEAPSLPPATQRMKESQRPKVVQTAVAKTKAPQGLLCPPARAASREGKTYGKLAPR